ncbi:exopolysaccharide biosynthesis protein [Faunimonas sp. B44]
MQEQLLSGILQKLGKTEREHVPLQSVLAAVGTRVHGTALFILSVPEAVPLPIPSASMILGMPIIMIAGHLVIFGERAGLPRRMQTLPVPARTLRLIARYLSPILRIMERVSRPRLGQVAGRERVIGLVCVYLAVILLLPIPFFNAIPATLLAIIAWGMIQRDGMAIAAGLVGTALITVGVLVMSEFIAKTASSFVPGMR